jgi:hypothetical protein
MIPCPSCQIQLPITNTGVVVCVCGHEFQCSEEVLQQTTPLEQYRIGRCKHQGTQVGVADCDCEIKPKVYSCQQHDLCVTRLKVSAAAVILQNGSRKTVSQSCYYCPNWSEDKQSFLVRKAIRKELVVSHYKESLDWLSLVPASIDRITVYTKGGTLLDLNERVSVIPLPNVGREAHTILHHITSCYDSLAETTFTAQGNALDHAPDLFGLLEMEHPKPTSLTPHYSDYFPSQEIKDQDLITKVGPYTIRYGKFLHFGQRDSETNLRWFDKAWQSTFDCPLPDPYYFGYGAMWAIPRQTILARSIDFYKALMNQLLHQGVKYRQFQEPIDAWSIEGLWNAIFTDPKVYPGKIK